MHDDSGTVIGAAMLSPAESTRSCFAGPITFSVFDWRDTRPALGDLAGVAAYTRRGNLAPRARKAHA